MFRILREPTANGIPVKRGCVDGDARMVDGNIEANRDEVVPFRREAIINRIGDEKTTKSFQLKVAFNLDSQ